VVVAECYIKLMKERLFYISHWVIFVYTCIAVFAFLFNAFTHDTGIIRFLGYDVAPVIYLRVFAPILVFKFIDYIATGSTTWYPDQRRND